MASIGRYGSTDQAKTQTPPHREASISNAISDLDAVLGRLENYGERFQSMGDRIHGSRPQPVGSDACGQAAEPSSLISQINIRRERLVDIANTMEDAIGRLDSGL